MIIPPLYLGCDISKRFLDIYDPSADAVRRIDNSPDQTSLFAASLKGSSALVVMEATGPYDRTLRKALDKAAVSYVRVNPTRARRYAQAAGFLAKTDAVDARMLSALGQALRPEAADPVDPACEALSTLQKRRDQLVGMRADERKRRHDAEGDMLASIDEHLTWLKAKILEMDKRIMALINQTPALKDNAARLQSAPGVGVTTATVLLAQLPELGKLSPKKIASLAGIAPVNNDSGAMRGVRRIKGGRRRVRQALYMAALSAIRSCKRFADFYDRIVERSKAKKVAIIAVARKLLTILNAIIRDNKNFV